MRQDILALTTDDLIAFTNRGVVKRSLREIDGLTASVAEADGALSLRFDDGTETIIPADGTFAELQCSCPSMKLCRHGVLLVMQYQAAVDASEEETSEAATGPWNPGTSTDEELAALFGAAVCTEARKRFDQGVLAELSSGEKPALFFRGLGVAVQFPIAHDLRYARCDAEGRLAKVAVVMAVLAFRARTSEEPFELLYTGTDRVDVSPLLAPLDLLIERLLADGISLDRSALSQGLPQLIERCAEADFIWLEEIATELQALLERYHKGDALFDPAALIDLLGQLWLRITVLSGAQEDIPQQSISGYRLNRSAKTGFCKLIGLGSAAIPERDGLCIRSYFQDEQSGQTLFIDDHLGGDVTNWEQCGNRIKRGAKVGCIGASTLLCKSGKRLPSLAFQPGREIGINPQSFQWEQLKEPLLATAIDAIHGRLSRTAPLSLSPRTGTEQLFVFPVAQLEQCHFNEVTQQVEALLSDEHGAMIRLIHQRHSGSSQGAEHLLTLLHDPESRLCFVSGRVSLKQGALQCEPFALVFEREGSREVVIPWYANSATARTASAVKATLPEIDDPHHHWLHELAHQLSTVLIRGTANLPASFARDLTDHAEQGRALGLIHLSEQVVALEERLRRGEPLGAQLKKLSMLLVIAE